MKRVKCDAAGVRWTVVGVVDGRTEAESKQSACAQWPEVKASYWESKNGKIGFVLCLASTAAP
jgi:hypothetical protein